MKTRRNKPERPELLPFFIPNGGCPVRCLFCNQTLNTGVRSAGSELVEEFQRFLSAAAAREFPAGLQLAFFGGSFTGLETVLQAELLRAAGEFFYALAMPANLRVSTHPALLSTPKLDLLRRHGVRHLELGVQSFDDAVLSLCGRGYTGVEAEAACRLVREAGFELGVQLMPGLPGASRESDVAGAVRAAALSPAEFRLYPCLVLAGTGLERLHAEGGFLPLPLEEALERCAQMLEPLLACGARALRIGLLEQESLRSGLVAGPAHPALGELVWSRLVARRVAAALKRTAPYTRRVLLLDQRCMSLFRGHGESGRFYLAGLLCGEAPAMEAARSVRHEGAVERLGHFRISSTEAHVLLTREDD